MPKLSELWLVGDRAPLPDELPLAGGLAIDTKLGRAYTKRDDNTVFELTRTTLELAPNSYVHDTATYDENTNTQYKESTKTILVDDMSEKQVMVFREGFYMFLNEDYTISADGIVLTDPLVNQERITYISGFK